MVAGAALIGIFGTARCRSRWVLLWAWGAVRAVDFGSTGEVRVAPWVSNPIARHMSCPVAHNTPTVCSLVGHEDSDFPLKFIIRTLPEDGLLYETSGNYRMFGSEPRHMPDPIREVPFLVTDPLHKIVYVPPMNTWPPDSRWGSFIYTVEVDQALLDEDAQPTPTTDVSEEGLVVLTNIHGKVAVSNFDNYDVASGGWSISGNLVDEVAGGLKHHAIITGQLSHYVYGVDEVQYLDFATGLERSKWYFEAAPEEFIQREFLAGYGGTLAFTVRSLYGNFSELNDPLDWITLECEACNSGQGKRIIRYVDELFRWEGGNEHRVVVDLKPLGRWHLDPLNAAMNFTLADECDIAAVLSNVTRFAILGDFTRGGEGVALDDVEVTAAPANEQPKYPLGCQQGCVCSHNSNLQRLSCC